MNAVQTDTRNLSAVLSHATTLLPVGIATILADALLWQGHLGLSVALFFAALGLLLWLHPRGYASRAKAKLWLALLVASCVQSMIELSFSNVVSLVATLLLLAGQIFHAELAGLWARVSERFYQLALAPLRWGKIGLSLASDLRGQSGQPLDAAAFLGKALWVFAPALILLAVFAGLFAQGNAVFARALSELESWFLNLFSIARILFWLFVATLSLGLFFPSETPTDPRWWTRVLPRIPRPDFRLATWQSAAVLVPLNALFLWVNTIDACYLWTQRALPDGVNHSTFVHDGVNSVITAVVLSAVIIAGIFQFDDRVAGRRWLKNLAHVWVMQNFILLAGCAKRLKFYTDDCLLTEKRIYVLCFLALVAAGFATLALFVEKRRSFNWLLGRNVAAVLTLFFGLQFAEVSGLVARYNLAEGPKRGIALDINYLSNLGPGAWPHLVAFVEAHPDTSTSNEIARGLSNIKAPDGDWRAFQLREQRAYEVVVDFFRRRNR